MPKTVNLNKRAEYVALEILEEGKPVTPSEIDAHVGTGKYSSKYISFLKRDGFVITTNKNGRNVVSYSLVSKPDTSKLPPGAFPKADKPKVEKVAKAKKATKVKATKVAKPKEETFVLPAKKKGKSEKPVMDEGFVNPEPVAYSVDSDWDEINPNDDPTELA
jgi:hypothetical protein